MKLTQKLTDVHAWRILPPTRFAATGKKTYQVRVPEVGEFTISGVCDEKGKHKGYVAVCANVFNVLPCGDTWWHLTGVDGSHSFTHRGIFTLDNARLACENFRLKYAKPETPEGFAKAA